MGHIASKGILANPPLPSLYRPRVLLELVNTICSYHNSDERVETIFQQSMSFVFQKLAEFLSDALRRSTLLGVNFVIRIRLSGLEGDIRNNMCSDNRGSFLL